MPFTPLSHTGTITLTQDSDDLIGSGTAMKVWRQGYYVFPKDAPGVVVVIGEDPTADQQAKLDQVYTGETVEDSEYRVYARDIAGELTLLTRIRNDLLAAGSAVGSPAAWKFLPSTSAGDPGANYFSMNHADPTLVDKMYFSKTDAGGNLIGAELADYEGGKLQLRAASRPGTALSYSVIMVTDSGDYMTLDVVYSAGSATYNASENIITFGTLAGAGLNFDVQVADTSERDLYDAEELGYRVLVSDMGDGRAGIQTLLDNESEAVWSAPAYVTGPKGGKGDPGLDVTWKPAGWSATAFAVNDALAHKGSAYICTSAHTGAANTEPGVGVDWATVWDLMVEVISITGTSDTSVEIGTGSKGPFTTQAGKGWTVGTRLRLASASNTAKFIEGVITGYSGTDLTVDVDEVGGSGAVNDWNISIAGIPGAPGANGSDGGGLKGIAVATVDIEGGDPSTDYEAGDTVGGVVLTAGMAILRATPGGSASDGVYPASASGAASRHSTFDTWDKLAGATFPVRLGDFSGSTFVNTDAVGGGTIDSDALSFIQQSGIGSLFEDDLSSDYDASERAQARANIGHGLFSEEASPPSTGADVGAVYTKESGGQTELFYREESDGDEVQITKAGRIGGFPAPDFTSSEQTVSADTELQVAHGLGAVPTLWNVSLRCNTAQYGYAVGDEIRIAENGSHTGDTGFTAFVNATNVVIVQSSSMTVIKNTGADEFNAGAITPSNWRWVVRAWL